MNEKIYQETKKQSMTRRFLGEALYAAADAHFGRLGICNGTASLKIFFTFFVYMILDKSSHLFIRVGTANLAQVVGIGVL